MAEDFQTVSEGVFSEVPRMCKVGPMRVKDTRAGTPFLLACL